MVFGRLFRRDKESDAIAATLYGAIVAQARAPALYRDLEVSDTVDGRFEMIVLHTILVLDRLQTDTRAASLAQKVFDLHCTDMDRSLREMGIGDLGVPKRMKTMAARFYGRAGSYRDALAAADISRLSDAFARNVYGRQTPAAHALAAYAVAAYKHLCDLPDADLLQGRIAFPEPATSAEAAA